MPLIEPKTRSFGNYTPSGRQRRNGTGIGRQTYNPGRVPGLGRARIRELEKKYGRKGYDRFCYNCNTMSTKLCHVSRGRDIEERSAWVCNECCDLIGETRKCKSVKDKCSPDDAEKCRFCKEITDRCRFVRMWKNGKIYKACPVCPSVREGVKEWICHPDYLLDHSKARCCECKIIVLSSPRYFSRGRCCKTFGEN